MSPVTPDRTDVAAWAASAPRVPADWFVRSSTLHGVMHTQRVHIHAQRLTGALRWHEPDTHLALAAALWHDIGRTHDGVEPAHGAESAARAIELGLTEALAPADADIILFAMLCHSRSDTFAEEEAVRRREARRTNGARRLAEPERALRILWLLKDADALDRVRLADWEAADPGQLRHPCTRRSIGFAGELLAVLH